MYTTTVSEPVGSFLKPERDHRAHEHPIPISSEPLLGRSPSALPTTVQLKDPGNTTACSSLTFFWSHSPERPFLMMLSIVNCRKPTSANPPAPLEIPASSSKILAEDIPSDSYKYTWHIVDVPEGWYVVDLTQTSPTTMGISTQSSPFFVTEGGVSLCRYNSSAFSVPHKPNPSHHSAPHPLHPAELAGIVLGAVFGVCILTVAFLFPRLWRRSLPSPKRRRLYVLY